MIKLTGRLVCTNREESKIVRHYLPEHKRLTHEEAGCISFDVTETADPLIWQVEECFTDKDAFDTHQIKNEGFSLG